MEEKDRTVAKFVRYRDYFEIASNKGMEYSKTILTKNRKLNSAIYVEFMIPSCTLETIGRIKQMCKQSESLLDIDTKDDNSKAYLTVGVSTVNGAKQIQRIRNFLKLVCDTDKKFQASICVDVPRCLDEYDQVEYKCIIENL